MKILIIQMASKTIKGKIIFKKLFMMDPGKSKNVVRTDKYLELHLKM